MCLEVYWLTICQGIFAFLLKIILWLTIYYSLNPVEIRARVTDRQGDSASQTVGVDYLLYPYSISVASAPSATLGRNSVDQRDYLETFNYTLMSGVLNTQLRAGNLELITTLFYASLYTLNTGPSGYGWFTIFLSTSFFKIKWY